MDIADELDRIGRSIPAEAWADVPPSDSTVASLWFEVRQLRALLWNIRPYVYGLERLREIDAALGRGGPNV
jgi:hypothetical protein